MHQTPYAVHSNCFHAPDDKVPATYRPLFSGNTAGLKELEDQPCLQNYNGKNCVE